MTIYSGFLKCPLVRQNKTILNSSISSLTKIFLSTFSSYIGGLFFLFILYSLSPFLSLTVYIFSEDWSMAKRRSTASCSAGAIVALMVVSVLVLQADYVQAATYIVGDSLKWAFNVVDWPKGKHFKAGDVLGIIYIL